MSNLIGYVYLLLAVVLGITSNGFLKTTNAQRIWFSRDRFNYYWGNFGKFTW